MALALVKIDDFPVVNAISRSHLKTRNIFFLQIFRICRAFKAFIKALLLFGEIPGKLRKFTIYSRVSNFDCNYKMSKSEIISIDVIQNGDWK